MKLGALMKTNRGVALIIIVILFPILLSICFSDWAFKQLSDGFYLGMLPIIYICLSIFLIAITIFDAKRNERQQKLDDLSVVGMIKVAMIILSSLPLAFYVDKIGLIFCTALLVVVCSIIMGLRNIRHLLVYSTGISVVIFGVLNLIGFDFIAMPNF